MDENYYTVRFYWEDKSINETSFRLAVAECTNTSKDFPKIESCISLSDSNYYKIYDYKSVLEATEGDINYVGGSLFAGSQELIMRFPTGRLFEVQLFSVNARGYSDGCLRCPATDGVYDMIEEADYSYYTSVTSSPALNKKYGSSSSIKFIGYDYVPASEAAFYKRINLVCTSYVLDGGILSGVSDGIFQDNKYLSFIPYKLNAESDNQSESMLELIAIDGSAVTLKKCNIDWTEWDYFNSGIQTQAPYNWTFTPYKYYNPNKYKNFTVYAVYGVNAADVTITSVTVQPQPELALARITMNSVPENDPSATGTSIATNGTGSVPIGRGSRQLITVSVAAGASPTVYNTFSKFCLWVGGVKIQEIISTSNTCEFAAFNSDRLNAGASTQIMVEASNSYGTASQVILVKCEN